MYAHSSVTPKAFLRLTLPRDRSAASLVRRALADANVGGERAAEVALLTTELVNNAVLHGCGDEVRIEVVDRAERVRVEVRDDGSGLPAPIHVLTRTARAGRGRRGRGLAIVADIARRHGGRLASAPTAGGACLVLDLPALRPAEAPTEPHRVAARSPRAPRTPHDGGAAA